MLPAQIPAAASEVVALGSAIGDVIASVKAGGSLLQDAQAALADLIAAGTGIGSIGADIKKPENQVFFLYALLLALEPQA